MTLCYSLFILACVARKIIGLGYELTDFLLTAFFTSNTVRLSNACSYIRTCSAFCHFANKNILQI